jgi:hypothetical protein
MDEPPERRRTYLNSVALALSTWKATMEWNSDNSKVFTLWWKATTSTRRRSLKGHGGLKVTLNNLNLNEGFVSGHWAV